MKRLLIALAWVFGLLALALFCWIATLRAAWPLWVAPLLFTGSLLALWLATLLWRAGRRWQAARALHRGNPAPVRSGLADLLARDWETGLAALGASQLSLHGWPLGAGRRARAARALPCLLMLGEQGSGKTTLLARTRLASSLRPVKQDQPITPTDALAWWFFDRSVVLDPSGALADPDNAEHENAAWGALLRRLVTLRGKRALNGLVLTLAAPRLLAALDDKTAAQALADAGLALRAQVDEVCAAFNARIPVHIVITQADRLPGFSAWAESLDGATREQPVGLLARQGEAVDAFLARTFTQSIERFADLRLLDETLTAYRPGDGFFIGTRIAALQGALKRFLIPAFTTNPYGGLPHLCGLFFSGCAAPTVASQPVSPTGEGWFSRQLFDQVLPTGMPLGAPRTALPVRRALYAWYAFNGACAALLGAGWIDLHGSLSALQDAPAAMVNPQRGLASNLDSLSAFPGREQALAALGKGRHALAWPFRAQLESVARADQQGFVDAFEAAVLRDGLLPMLQARVATVARSGSDTLVAAYAQHLVRRINLLDAALAGQPLDALPRPGSALPIIVADFDPAAPFNPLVAERFQDLYLAYLNAHPSRLALERERTQLCDVLAQLALPGRGDSWLIAWAELQPSLSPMTAAGLWDVPDNPQLPRLPAAYAAGGFQAIARFVDEVKRASSAADAAAFRPEIFEVHFKYAQRVAWYHFAQAFVTSRAQLVGNAAWNHVLANLLTPRDPYLLLITGMSAALRDGAPNSVNDGAGVVPAWIRLVDRLARLMPVTQPTAAGSGLAARSLAWAQMVNGVGQAAVQSSNDVGTLWDAAGSDFAVGRRLADYQAALEQALQALRTGEGAAAELARKTLTAQTVGGEVTPLNTAATIFASIGGPTTAAPQAGGAALASAKQRADALRAKAGALSNATGVPDPLRVPGANPLLNVRGPGGTLLNNAGRQALGAASHQAAAPATHAAGGANGGNTAAASNAGDMGRAGDAQVAGVPGNTAAANDLEAPIRAVARGALDFAADYAARAASCRLQTQWESNVLAPIAGMPDSPERTRLLFADKGLIASFTDSVAAPYIVREPSQYRPQSVITRPVPFTNSFLAFIGESDGERIAAATRARQQAALVTSRARTEASQQAELTSLQQQIQTLTAQADQLATTHGAVQITAQPSKVNAGAREWPQQITLALQCADTKTTLQNLNFPSTAAFDWSPDRCGGVSLEVRFANATLRQNWDGARGFIDFLRASVDGRYRFDLAKIPSAPGALKSAQVKTVDVFWQQSGQGPLLDAYATLDKTRAQLQDLTARRDAVQALLNNAAAARASEAQLAASVGDADQGGVAPGAAASASPLPPGVAPLPGLTDLAAPADPGAAVPAQIGICWGAAPR